MPAGEYEPIPSEMSPVNRYYDDIRLRSDSYVDLQIIAEKLLEQEGMTLPDQSYDALYGNVLPSGTQFGTDPQAAIESFIVFPLEVIAPWAEMTRPPGDLESWYENTARQIMASTAESHKDSCYTLSYSESKRCKMSDTCPRRTLTAVLQGPTSDFNFSKLEYLTNPKKEWSLALSKLEVAKKLNIVSNNDYVVSGARYKIAFAARFGSIL